MTRLDVQPSVSDWLYVPQTPPLQGTPTDSQSTTSSPVGTSQGPAPQAASPPLTCPSPVEPAQARGSHADLSSCEAVLTQKLKSLELQNSLPGQVDLVHHKSMALDPSCLLTPPNTPQGTEPAELEADLQEGASQQRKGDEQEGESRNIFH